MGWNLSVQRTEKGSLWLARGVKRAVAEKVREVMRVGWVARERNLGLSEGKRDPGSLGRG